MTKWWVEKICRNVKGMEKYYLQTGKWKSKKDIKEWKLLFPDRKIKK